LLAMVVNDNAENLIPRGALWFFASKLAPTGVSAQTKMPRTWRGIFMFDG